MAAPFTVHVRGSAPNCRANIVNGSPRRSGAAWRTKLISAGSRLAATVVPGHGAPPASAIRRLVVIKPASLGDVILATPAISLLRVAFPTAHLSLAVGQWSLPAARGVLGIDRLVDLGNFGTPGRFGVRDLPEAARILRDGSYDLAVVLDRRGAAVHRVRVRRHAHAEGDGDALVPEADAEHGDVAAEGADRGGREAGLVGALVAIPVAASLQILVIDYLERRYPDKHKK